MIRLYSIIGATATGKSEIAIKLSEYLPIEIVSCDSRQIYKYMNIGTAKPNEEDLKKVKHHLIDIITPDKIYNAKRFSDDAEKITMRVREERKLPLIVGGTGMYLNALVYGMFDEPPIPEGLKTELRLMSNEKLFERLERLDEVAVHRINRNDRYRIIRALEVMLTSGKSIFDVRRETKPKYDMVYFYITMNRSELYDRINERVDRMIEMGLLNEIEALLGKGYDFSSPGMRSVGYKEFEEYFLWNKSLEEVADSIKKNSRNYAKRQITWFNKQIKKGKHFTIGEGNIQKTAAFIAAKIEKEGIR